MSNLKRIRECVRKHRATTATASGLEGRARELAHLEARRYYLQAEYFAGRISGHGYRLALARIASEQSPEYAERLAEGQAHDRELEERMNRGGY